MHFQFQDTINVLNLNTLSRASFAVQTIAPNQHNSVFGIAVYQVRTEIID